MLLATILVFVKLILELLSIASADIEVGISLEIVGLDTNNQMRPRLPR